MKVFRLQVVWLMAILGVWSTFFGRAWLGSIYAKAYEVEHFSNLPQEMQRNAIFAQEMPLLFEKVSNLPDEEEFLLVVPKKPWEYPIGNNPPLLRALTGGKYEVVRGDLVKDSESGILFSSSPLNGSGQPLPDGIMVEPLRFQKGGAQ